MSKFKVGDKVRVLKAETGDKAKVGDILTVSGGTTNYPETSNGDMWRLSEIELINEGETTVGKRTFKLLKDTPFVAKGAIYQEKCDDGTQEYVLLDDKFNKDQLTNGKMNSQNIYHRPNVEDQPEWFVEVFKVTPEYMTQGELDQWEAFKKGTTAPKRTYKKTGKYSKKNGKS